MIDCPCGFGKNINENQKTCPICGVDLTPLHYLESIPEIYYKKGKELSKQGQLDDAVKQLTASIVFNYNNVEPYIELGSIYIQKKLYDEAIVQFGKALEIDPKNIEAKKAIDEAKKIKSKTEEAVLRQTHKTAVLKKLLVIIPLVAFILGLIIPIGQNLIKSAQKGTSVPESIASSSETVSKELVPEEKLTPSLSEVIDNIKKDITENNSLKDLKIKVSSSNDNKKLYISGEVPTEIHKSLIEEIAKNIAGKNEVDIKNLKVTPIPEEEPEWLYEVKNNDTLAKIAYIFYGDSRMWNKIYEYNKEKVDDPDKIYKGQILKIPAK